LKFVSQYRREGETHPLLAFTCQLRWSNSFVKVVLNREVPLSANLIHSGPNIGLVHCALSMILVIGGLFLGFVYVVFIFWFFCIFFINPKLVIIRIHGNGDILALLISFLICSLFMFILFYYLLGIVSLHISLDYPQPLYFYSAFLFLFLLLFIPPLSYILHFVNLCSFLIFFI
jgi:hypothetical protein